jgi:hypothetical protein
MTFATSSVWARSSHTSEASVAPSPSSTNWTDPAGNFRSFPPADVRMQRAAEVVLADLPVVE